MINNLDLSISDTNQLTTNINNLNIIGIMVGILLGVIDINYINKLEINNTHIIILCVIKLIVYISLIGIAGSTYSDYKTIQNKDNNAKWSIAIKPLIPFLCAISIQTLILIINKLNSTDYKILNSKENLDSSIDSSSIDLKEQ